MERLLEAPDSQKLLPPGTGHSRSVLASLHTRKSIRSRDQSKGVVRWGGDRRYESEATLPRAERLARTTTIDAESDSEDDQDQTDFGEPTDVYDDWELENVVEYRERQNGIGSGDWVDTREALPRVKAHPLDAPDNQLEWTTRNPADVVTNRRYSRLN